MAESINPENKSPESKDQVIQPPQTSERTIKLETVPELSVEELDDAILEDDPEFLSQIGKVGEDKSLSITEIKVSLDDEILNEEMSRLLRMGGIIAILVRVLPFFPRITLGAKYIKRRLRDFLISQRIRLINFLEFLKREGKEQALERIREANSRFSVWRGSWLKFIGKLPLVGKLLFLATVILAVGTSVFIYRSWKYGVITSGESLFLTSFDKVANQVYEYKPKEDLEPFFENLRGESNVFMIPKMVVNLKKSKESSPLPMAAFEFYIEGWASEAIIEFKDREVEFRDIMLRTLEDYTFEQLDSAEGKKDLCIKIEKIINSRLTSGQLKRVLVKTAIVKQ